MIQLRIDQNPSHHFNDYHLVEQITIKPRHTAGDELLENYCWNCWKAEDLILLRGSLGYMYSRLEVRI